ncbi:hypothetical protein IFO69_16990 [Echinicola sp. CAU 1574]|uniref:Uncharacterized protein n=1 Tax=Echinicola arenosa TaxID=2774144 RepID=A0ABR9ANZ5_9BACT|nr:hypothetical protein [Echinicola arenosa]MBD8490450.1 hypothetical protein [Echinicola arenosa]
MSKSAGDSKIFRLSVSSKKINNPNSLWDWSGLFGNQRKLKDEATPVSILLLTE